MLPRNQQMEYLSRMYVQAVVTQAGGICAEPRPDFGIDFGIHGVVHDQNHYSDDGAIAHLQLKSTTEAAYHADKDAYQYDLPVKNYHQLRKAVVKVPRFLVLFVMPKEENLWLHQDHESLRLRHCAYYLSLKGMPGTTNQNTVSVMVPRAQVFSIEFLRDLEIR